MTISSHHGVLSDFFSSGSIPPTKGKIPVVTCSSWNMQELPTYRQSGKASFSFPQQIWQKIHCHYSRTDSSSRAKTDIPQYHRNSNAKVLQCFHFRPCINPSMCHGCSSLAWFCTYINSQSSCTIFQQTLYQVFFGEGYINLNSLSGASTPLLWDPGCAVPFI